MKITVKVNVTIESLGVVYFWAPKQEPVRFSQCEDKLDYVLKENISIPSGNSFWMPFLLDRL